MTRIALYKTALLAFVTVGAVGVFAATAQQGSGSQAFASEPPSTPAASKIAEDDQPRSLPRQSFQIVDRSAGQTSSAPGEDKATAPPDKPVASPNAEIRPKAVRQMDISGKVVDDITGEPISPVHVQTGAIDKLDRNKVNWFSGLKSGPKRDNTFGVGLPRGGGFAARVVADGYRPEAVIVGDLPADVDSIVLTVRLKRSRLVRGTVLDHADQPVPDAFVFAVRTDTRLNLRAGKAWMHSPEGRGSNFDSVDQSVTSVQTDENGRFEIATDDAGLAVSHKGLDAWAVKIADQGELLIRLPKPCKLEIEYAIAGGDAEGRIIYQLQSHQVTAFEGFGLMQTVSVKNGERVILAALPPGPYHVYRHQTIRLGYGGRSIPTDGEIIQLAPGESKAVRVVREHGARLRGKVSRPQQGVVISVLSESPTTSPFDVFRTGLTYTALIARADGTFQTEKIAPGRYRLLAETWAPEAPGFGSLVPKVTSRAEQIIDVPDGGEFEVPELVLK